MKDCTEIEFHSIKDYLNWGSFDRNGFFSKKNSGELMLTLRSRTLPVFPPRTEFLEIEGDGTIPLEEMLEVVASDVSKPKWDVYAVHNIRTGKFYYNNLNLCAQSVVEGEPWQKD